MNEWRKWNRDISKHPFYMNFSDFKQTLRITSMFGKIIPRNFKPNLRNRNTLLRHILYRRYRNMNTFIAVVGDVRSGKSYFALKFAEDYMKEANKEFDVDKQCSFELLPFFEWSKYAKDSAFVLDEIQMHMSSREWWDKQHKVFNQFCDIQGLRRNLLLMAFPNISYIDKHLRFLLNYVVRTVHQGKVIWFKVVTRHEVGKSWLSKIGSIRFREPSKKTVSKYETMKKQFTDYELDQNIAMLKGEREQFNYKNSIDRQFGSLITTKIPST